MFNLALRDKVCQYPFNINYNMEYDYETYGCDEICRCSRIVNPEIPSNINTYLRIYEMYWKPKSDKVSIDDVLAFCFVRKEFNSSNVEIEICNGYYGDEIGGIFYRDSDFWEKAKLFNTLSTEKKLYKLLEIEYGYILPKLLSYPNWELKEVDPKLITKKNINISYGITKEYKEEIESELLINNSNHDIENIKLYAPLVIPNFCGGYRLIDGYHRLSALTSKYKIKNNTNKKTKIFSFDKIWVICPML